MASPAGFEPTTYRLGVLALNMLVEVPWVRLCAVFARFFIMFECSYVRLKSDIFIRNPMWILAVF